MGDGSVPNQLFEQWRKQFEEGAQAWTRLLSQAPPTTATPDPTAFWRPVLDQGVQTWAKLFAQTPATPELLTQWKQFLDQWIEAWSKVLGQTMGTEQFAKLMGQSLDQFLVAQGSTKKAADQQAGLLTRSVTRFIVAVGGRPAEERHGVRHQAILQPKALRHAGEPVRHARGDRRDDPDRPRDRRGRRRLR